MGCNDYFFKELLNAIENTWPKDLIDNKYKDFTYFSYTSCDETHPTPCIAGHTIYVDCEDDLWHTYDKTKKAYDMLKYNGYVFDYILRTNTSCYINVANCISKIHTLSADDFIGNFEIGLYINNKYIFDQFAGNFWIASSKILDQIFNSNISEQNIIINIDGVNYNPKLADDSIMTYILNIKNIKHNRIGIDHNPWVRYKICKNEDLININKTILCQNTEDPHVIKDRCVLQFRTIYEKEERITKGQEIKHLKEIHNILKK